MSRQDRTTGRQQRSTNRRIGCQLRNAAGGAIANNTLTTVPWDTADYNSPSFITVTGSTLTFPTKGLYLAELLILPNVATAFDIVEWAGPVTYDHAAGAPSGSTAVSFGPIPMAAGNTVQFKVRQQTGGPVTITAQLNLYRMAL